MAKAKDGQWALAKALFEADKSLREIEKETRIPFKTIDYRSKKEGWKRHTLTQHIVEQVRIKEDFSTLETAQKEVVSNEVRRILDAREFYSSKARMVINAALVGLKNDMTPANAKLAMETMHKGLVVENIVPYYPNSPIINNANVHQEKEKEPVRFTRAID